MSETGLNIKFERGRRSGFDSCLVSVCDGASVTAFEVREHDAQVLKQLLLKETGDAHF